MRDHDADRALLFTVQGGLYRRPSGAGRPVVLIAGRGKGKSQQRAANDGQRTVSTAQRADLREPAPETCGCIDDIHGNCLSAQRETFHAKEYFPFFCDNTRTGAHIKPVPRKWNNCKP